MHGASGWILKKLVSCSSAFSLHLGKPLDIETTPNHLYLSVINDCATILVAQ